MRYSERAPGIWRVGLLALSLLAAAACGAADAPADGGAQPTLPKVAVRIATAEGPEHAFQVELADHPAARHRGLMFRWSVPADGGMLFVFERPEHISMWMRNTLVELTMLFIRQDGTIARVVDRTVPLSEESIHSGEAVRAVLELRGGSATRLAIRPGDRLLHDDLF